MTDRFADFQPSLSGPASTGFTVVPNDATDLPEATRALYVGMGGNLAVTMLSGAEFVLSGLPDGSLLPLRLCGCARRVPPPAPLSVLPEPPPLKVSPTGRARYAASGRLSSGNRLLANSP